MELQFQKTSLPCLRKILDQVEEQEQTLEVKLNEGMGDIGRVLGAWGQVLVRTKQWETDSVAIAGGVMAWVLYEPEEGGDCQQIEAWLPFQMRWSIPNTGRDGIVQVIPLLHHVDARSISARKLMIRAVISGAVQAMVPGEVDLYTPTQTPEDVQLLKKTYPMQIPTEAGEKTFSLDEELGLPAACQKVEKLIRYSLQPEILEQKVMAGRLVFRGVGVVHLLARGEDGQLHSWDMDVPFSQFTELDRDYDQQAEGSVIPAVTALEVEQEGDHLRLKVGLAGQYVICDRPMVELVEDAYSPVRQVECIREQLQIPALLDQESRTVRAEQTLDAGGTAVDLEFYPFQLPGTDRGSWDELNGKFQLLYYDPDRNLQMQTVKWSAPVSEYMQGQSDLHMGVVPSGKPKVSAESPFQLGADIRLDMHAYTREGMEAVSALELGEEKEPDPLRPSLILRKCGSDSLWQLAKRTGSTVESICAANGIDSEPDPDRMLIIPVN